ncbi:uncharacterized protein TNCV_1516211 [Trichonephila clavipes]|nr:uncharacterized protein TNCV_1516211 [Trichonephila clavipes]
MIHSLRENAKNKVFDVTAGAKKKKHFFEHINRSISTIKGMCSKCPPCMSKQASNTSVEWLSSACRNTVVHRKYKPACRRATKPIYVVTTSRYTSSLRWPHWKKSNGVRFGEHGGHRTGPLTSDPTVGHAISSQSRTRAAEMRRSPIFPLSLSLSLSCWNQSLCIAANEHHWYQCSRPGGSLAHGFTRQDQTLLSRFRSGHIKSMQFSEGRKSCEMCTNCSSEPATPAHIPRVPRAHQAGLSRRSLAGV